MKKEGTSAKHFFLGLMLVIGLLSLAIALPFVSSIITGAILAFVFYPFYNKICKLFKSKSFAAFITALLIVLIVTIPGILIANSLTQETHYLYLRTKQHLFSGSLVETCYDDTFICNTVSDFNDLMRDPEIKAYLINLLNTILEFVTDWFSDLILSLPKLSLHLVVILFTTYYALKDGKEFVHRIAKVAPLKVHHQEQIVKQFGDVTHAVIYGSFIVALVQGTFGAFGLWLFGIKSFIWWAVVMTFFALIPFIGPGIIWLPASFVLALTGYVEGETGLIWRGLGLFFYGVLIISTVDNIFKPLIVAERAKVHPLLILIGVLGGLLVFGLIGIFVGPLVLALFQNLVEIYEKERKPHLKEKQRCIAGRGKHRATRS